MNEQWVHSREEPDVEVLAESALAQAQATIQIAMDRAGVSQAQLSRSMDRQRSYVSRMLSGSHNLTVKTMALALSGCGFEIQFGLAPIAWNWIAEPPMPTECNKVPSSEGTLVLASFTALAAGCPSGTMGDFLN